MSEFAESGKSTVHKNTNGKCIHTVQSIWNFHGAVAQTCEEYDNFSRSNGATHCGGAIKFLTRAKRDQDNNAFGLR